MPEYFIQWTINITARSPREAAKKALKIQRDPTSTATWFEVLNKREDVYTIDAKKGPGKP